MTYSAKTIANTMMDIMRKNEQDIDKFKIAKMVYFAHCLWLQAFEKPLIDEPIIAYEFGPVIMSLYYCKNNNNYIKESRYIDGKLELFIPKIPEEDEETIEFINETCRIYGNFDNYQMMKIIHSSGSPWEIVTKSVNDADISTYSIAIPDSLIIESYGNMLRKIEEEECIQQKQ
jgi:uncharacterized phage-associated protein